jgi:hypothetical protein
MRSVKPRRFSNPPGFVRNRSVRPVFRNTTLDPWNPSRARRATRACSRSRDSGGAGDSSGRDGGGDSTVGGWRRRAPRRSGRHPSSTRTPPRSPIKSLAAGSRSALPRLRRRPVEGKPSPPPPPLHLFLYKASFGCGERRPVRRR